MQKRRRETLRKLHHKHKLQTSAYSSLPPGNAGKRDLSVLLTLWLERTLRANSKGPKLQAVVNDILQPLTAVIAYAMGLEKVPADGQFFVGAEMVVRL